MEFLQRIDVGNVLIQFAVLLFSLSAHEAAHAWMAHRLGDCTASSLGRVTLNPIAHIDPIGTVLFPLLQFFTNLPLIGWAKPVPVNPAYLKSPQRDQMNISLAGPGANLMLAAFSFMLLALIKLISPQARGMILNMSQTLRVPHQSPVLAPILGTLLFMLIINMALTLFNLIPIPPLDGHWILYGLLPYNAVKALDRISSYGIFVLYGLMFLGMFRYIFKPIWWVLGILLVF